MSFLGSLFSGPTDINATTNSGVQSANQALSNTTNQQQSFVNALAAQNGIQNQANVYNQLQGVANGTGPNPAQAMLAQQTGQNVSNQNALMAGQRGANQNVGLLARQAAQQGAATQQQSVGQGATLQANQSLNALGQLSGIAGQQVAQQQSGLNQLSGMDQAQQQALLNQINGTNQASQAQYSSQLGPALGALSGIAGAVPGVGGMLSSGLSAGAKAAGAEGGQITPFGFTKTMMAEGGMMPDTGSQVAAKKENYSGSKSFLDHFKEKAPMMAEGGMAKNMKMGGHVPGKAAVGGAKNDYANDTVPAVLSPGEWVIPRSVTKSANPRQAAAKFVDALLKKKGKK